MLLFVNLKFSYIAINITNMSVSLHLLAIPFKKIKGRKVTKNFLRPSLSREVQKMSLYGKMGSHF